MADTLAGAGLASCAALAVGLPSDPIGSHPTACCVIHTASLSALQITTIMPFIFVLSVSAIKEFFEDHVRLPDGRRQ